MPLGACTPPVGGSPLGAFWARAAGATSAIASAASRASRDLRTVTNLIGLFRSALLPGVAGGKALLRDDVDGPLDRYPGDAGLAIDPAVAAEDGVLFLAQPVHILGGFRLEVRPGELAALVLHRGGTARPVSLLGPLEAAHDPAEHEVEDEGQDDQRQPELEDRAEGDLERLVTGPGVAR